jgi:hypothetical protein
MDKPITPEQIAALQADNAKLQERNAALEKQLASNPDRKRVVELEKQLAGNDARELEIRKIEVLGIPRQQAEAVLRNRSKSEKAKKDLAARREKRRAAAAE